MEIRLLPRNLEFDVGNGESRDIRSNDKMDLESSAGAPVERAAFNDPSRLTHPQGVGRNAASFAVIFGDVNRTASAPNSARIGQSSGLLKSRRSCSVATNLEAIRSR